MEAGRMWNLILRSPLSDSNVRIMVSDNKRYLLDATIKSEHADALISKINGQFLTPEEVFGLLNGDDTVKDN